METANVMSGGRALTAGVVAGVAQIVTVYVVAAIIGFVLGDAARFVGSAVTGSLTTAIWWGRGILATMAIVWALAYSLLSRYLPGEGWRNGLIYGVLVWVVSTLVLFPLLADYLTRMGVPGAASGYFGLGFGGWGSALTALVAHAVYGIVLGSFAYGGRPGSAERKA